MSRVWALGLAVLAVAVAVLAADFSIASYGASAGEKRCAWLGCTNSNPQKALHVFGLRNETVSAQCVVRAGRDLPDLSVSVGPLTREGGGSIPADHVTWTFVTGSAP
ncbi:MAG: hypothetical protein WC340_07180 [Kiritimatiellia bacterium]